MLLLNVYQQAHLSPFQETCDCFHRLDSRMILRLAAQLTAPMWYLPCKQRMLVVYTMSDSP